MLAAMAAAEVGDEQYARGSVRQRAAAPDGRARSATRQRSSCRPRRWRTRSRSASQPARARCSLAEERTHVMVYEWGGPAIHSGLVMRGIAGRRGRVDARADLRGGDDLGPGGDRRAREHAPQLRRPHLAARRVRRRRRRGPRARRRASTSTARGSSTRRSRPASRAAGVGAPRRLGQICFSKGLGCPLGALVAGSAELIERAWESKFLFGGAMRQAGIIAAAALYALDHHVDRLADDHARARRLAEGDRPAIDPATVETNFVELESRRARPASRGARGSAGVARRRSPAGLTCARVTHLDISRRRHRARRSSSSRARSQPTVSTPDGLAAELERLVRARAARQAPAEHHRGSSARRRADLGDGGRRRRRRGEAARRRPTRSTASARSRRRSPPPRSCSCATRASSTSRTRSTSTSTAPRTRRRCAACSRTPRACSARRTTTRG